MEGFSLGNLDLTSWLMIAAMAVLLLFSGFFSSSETSLFSINHRLLDQMHKDGNKRASLIESMLSKPRRLIITILIGNELVNVAASVISASLIIRLVGADSKWFNLLIMIPLLLLVGEITPKTLAIRNKVAFATFQSRPIDLLSRLIKPLRVVVRKVADLIITLLVGKERSQGNLVTEDMVRVLAGEAVFEGVLDPFEAQYINHIFDFGNQIIEDVMVPRAGIFFMPVSMHPKEMVAELVRTRYTKVPIYHESRDRILGILYARDLQNVDLPVLYQNPSRLKKILRKPYFVPETKPVSQLFHTLRKRKLSLAFAVDEYGGITGMVTMEDLLECIFGEIRSGSEAQLDGSIERLKDGRLHLPGSLLVRDFNEKMKWELDEDHAETLGGLVLHKYGELPAEGAEVVIADIRFKVLMIRDNRIMELTAERASKDTQEQKETGMQEEAETDTEVK